MPSERYDLYERIVQAAIREYTDSPLCWDLPQWEWARANYVSTERLRHGMMLRDANGPGLPYDAARNMWLRQMEADGWRYGPVGSVENKEHPWMIPYEDLPVDEKIRHRLRAGVADAMSLLNLALLPEYAGLKKAVEEA